MFLCHATTQVNVSSIEKLGLLVHPPKPQNYEGMSHTEGVFFAFNPEVAMDYVAASERYDGGEIVCFCVDVDNLNIEAMRYDGNNRCEENEDINSVMYEQDVKPDILTLMSDEQIQNAELLDFSDLRHYDVASSKIWEKIVLSKGGLR